MMKTTSSSVTRNSEEEPGRFLRPHSCVIGSKLHNFNHVFLADAKEHDQVPSRQQICLVVLVPFPKKVPSIQLYRPHHHITIIIKPVHN